MPLIMLTNQALERELMAAAREVERLDAIAGDVIHLRVEYLDK